MWKRRKAFLEAQALLEKNDYMAAEAAYSEILANEPELADARLHRAYVRLRMQSLDAALDDANRCVELRPESGVMRMVQGEILLARNENDKAYESLSKACELERDNGRAYYQLAKAALSLGKKDEAGDYFEIALQFEKDYVTAQWMTESLQKN